MELLVVLQVLTVAAVVVQLHQLEEAVLHPEVLTKEKLETVPFRIKAYGSTLSVHSDKRNFCLSLYSFFPNVVVKNMLPVCLTQISVQLLKKAKYM